MDSKTEKQSDKPSCEESFRLSVADVDRLLSKHGMTLIRGVWGLDARRPARGCIMALLLSEGLGTTKDASRYIAGSWGIDRSVTRKVAELNGLAEGDDYMWGLHAGYEFGSNANHRDSDSQRYLQGVADGFAIREHFKPVSY